MTTTSKVEELTGIKSGGEITSKYDIDAQNFVNCASNRMYIKLPALTTGISTLFTNCIPTKAPCTYLMIVKLSCFSDTGNTWAFWRPYKVSQLVAGGAITVTPAAALIDDGPGAHVVSFAKNLTKDSLDMLVDHNLGGLIFNLIVCVEIFCDKNF